MSIEHRIAYLTAAQQKQAQRLSGDEDLPGAIVSYYVGTKDGRAVGMPETIMVEVDPAGAIARIEVLSFSEPEDYLPRAHWYEQFQGKPLDDELSLKRAIRPVTGATLTAHTTTDAARRVLAVDRVLRLATPRSPSK